MAREKELFRDNLARLDEKFPEVELIPLLAVSSFLGLDPRTLKKRRDFPARKVGRFIYVPKSALASWLS